MGPEVPAYKTSGAVLTACPPIFGACSGRGRGPRLSLSCVCVCQGRGVTIFYQVSRLSLYGHTGVLGSGRSPL